MGARCNVVVTALCYKPEHRGFVTDEVNFCNLPNPSGRKTPGVHSASNTNEYHKGKNVFVE
jgi:hypothetical protein